MVHGDTVNQQSLKDAVIFLDEVLRNLIIFYIKGNIDLKDIDNIILKRLLAIKK